MPARRMVRRPMGRARRRTTWAVVPATVVALPAAGFAWVDLLANYNAMPNSVSAGITVLRAHIKFAFTIGTGFAAGNAITTALLRGQSSDVGNPGPVGSPNPKSDLYEDYLMWEQFVADVNGILTPGGADNWIWDVKSRRRLTNLNQSLLLGFGTSAGTPSLVYSSRVLLALP